MNIREKINALKLNIKQHQNQIKVLYKEIKVLENFDKNNSNNDNISNDTINSKVDNFCISTDEKAKKTSKNENLNKFL